MIKKEGGYGMILTVDVGNSHITLGGFSNDTLSFVATMATDLCKTEDEYAIRFKELFSLYQVDENVFDGAIVASVVPPLNRTVKKAIAKITEKEAIFVGPGIKSGIGIRCDVPSSVGADLIVDAVAAHYLYQSPALIIDVGTATKMTVVDEKGTFIGTSIMPGVAMGLDALSEKTAQLPKISLDTPATVICKNTQDCMRSGVVYGHASMIDGMIDRIQEEFGHTLSIYATGGMAESVIPLCKHTIPVDEHLALKGLYLLYRKNRPETK